MVFSTPASARASFPSWARATDENARIRAAARMARRNWRSPRQPVERPLRSAGGTGLPRFRHAYIETADFDHRAASAQLGSVVAHGDDSFFSREQGEIVVVPEHRHHITSFLFVRQPQANLEGHAAGSIFHANV